MRLQISDGVNVNFYVKTRVISKMGSPAKPGASSTLFNTLLCKETLSPGQEKWVWVRKHESLAGDGEGAPGLGGGCGLAQQRAELLGALPGSFAYGSPGEGGIVALLPLTSGSRG